MNASTIAASPITSFGGIVAVAAGANFESSIFMIMS